MSEIIDLNVWLDAKRKKDIESFKIKHPSQYACIKELGRKQGALEELYKLSYYCDKAQVDERAIKRMILKRIKEFEGVEK